MLTANARVSAFAVAWVALAAAMLLATPREFDRVRTLRAGAYRSDCPEEPHCGTEEYGPGPVLDTGNDHGGGEPADGRSPVAVLPPAAVLAQPAFAPVADGPFVGPFASVRCWRRPPGRAPPVHA